MLLCVPAAQANVISTAVEQMIIVAPVIVCGGGRLFLLPGCKIYVSERDAELFPLNPASPVP